MGGIDKDDPFAIFLMPPPNETPQERVQRLRRETEAQRVSDRIDEKLKIEKAAIKKKQRGLVKVLLLGQSESGKSTTLKNFRMKYAREAWKAERISWRAVIQLNLVRSIITIVETLQTEMETPKDDDAARRWSLSDASHGDEPLPLSVPLTNKHQLLKLRLGPLGRVQADLEKQLGAATQEIVSGNGEDKERFWMREFGVRAWKDALSRYGNLDGEQHMDEATEVIVRCKDDMKALWTDEAVRALLTKRKMRIEDSAGFFLDDLERIAIRTYEPSDDDIVRARLRTVGVQEYRINFGDNAEGSGHFLENISGDSSHEWVIYDVGGSRTKRNAWVPYFESVNAIIFLAPISCFDERLLEDPTVNRLEDSFLLWRAICNSKLLQRSTLILFLNKCDLLKRKLRSGTQVKPFLPSYGNRPNDAQAFISYLRDKFRDVLRQSGHQDRSTYMYATSVIDTKATATTLKTVRDSILREHLRTADLV